LARRPLRRAPAVSYVMSRKERSDTSLELTRTEPSVDDTIASRVPDMVV